ncbi:MAG: hypothetical protein ACRDIE_18255 [Chloroflexota bacterium]
MAKGKAEVEYPSSKLVKYLSVAAAAIGIAGVVLDIAVPVAQQLGKNKQAKAGLQQAISLTMLITLVRAAPRLAGQLRKLQAQLKAEVAA